MQTKEKFEVAVDTFDKGLEVMRDVVSFDLDFDNFCYFLTDRGNTRMYNGSNVRTVDVVKSA